MNEQSNSAGPTNMHGIDGIVREWEPDLYLPVWKGGAVECEMCAHQWVACYHMDSEMLECPNCQDMVYFIEY